MNWYIVHTATNMEQSVVDSIKQAVKEREFEDVIADARVITERIEDSDKTVIKYPGYVFVHMVMNPTTWYVIRNVRGVTSFLGSDVKNPSPISKAEEAEMGLCND